MQPFSVYQNVLLKDMRFGTAIIEGEANVYYDPVYGEDRDGGRRFGEWTVDSIRIQKMTLVLTTGRHEITENDLEIQDLFRSLLAQEILRNYKVYSE